MPSSLQHNLILIINMNDIIGLTAIRFRVVSQYFLHAFNINILNSYFVIDRFAGSHRTGLPQYHKYGLHANGAKGNVTCRQAYGNNKIVDFLFFGHNSLIGNREGRKSANLNVPFIFDHAIDDHTVTIVRVHGVCSIAYAIGYKRTTLTVVLGHNDICNHPAGLPNI
ncbi:hypothetical protein D3C72_994890 [compost metagenome]